MATKCALPLTTWSERSAFFGAQLEHLKATTESKQVTFKIAYGLPLNEMLKWGLYISEPRRCGLWSPDCMRRHPLMVHGCYAWAPLAHPI